MNIYQIAKKGIENFNNCFARKSWNFKGNLAFNEDEYNPILILKIEALDKNFPYGIPYNLTPEDLLAKDWYIVYTNRITGKDRFKGVKKK